MKISNFNFHWLNLRRNFGFGLLFCALAVVSGCSDELSDAGGNEGNSGQGQESSDVCLLVKNNPALAKTYSNSKNNKDSRGVVDDFFGDVDFSVPSLDGMLKIAPGFNPYYCVVEVPSGTPEESFMLPSATDRIDVLVSAGDYTQTGLPAKIRFVYNCPWGETPGWTKDVEVANIHYWIDGKVLASTGQNERVAYHVMDGAELSMSAPLQGQTDLYIHHGGKIVRAGNEGQVFTSGRVFADDDIVVAGGAIELLGDFYANGSIEAKSIRLVGGRMYAGCKVVANESLYITGMNSIISAGYVSAPRIELAGGDNNEKLNIVLRDKGYMYAESDLVLRNTDNISLRAEAGGAAMVETKNILVNMTDLIPTFTDVAVKYDSFEGAQDKDDLIFSESCHVNADIEYELNPGEDTCAPFEVVDPEEPDPDPVPEIENIGSLDGPEHGHPISATSVFTIGKNAYISWHTQGAGFHGCIEHATVDGGNVSLNAYLETSIENDATGEIDFNHVIFDDGRLMVVGDHPKKGGILGWVNCDNGFFPSSNSATLNLLTLYNQSFKDEAGVVHISNGGSGNCLIRNGGYYQVASVAGFETFDIAHFGGSGSKISPVARLASWTFDPSASEPLLPWERDGRKSGKHIATDGINVAMLSLINRDNAANTANASIKVYSSSDVRYENVVATHIVNDVALSPVDGKNVIAIEGNDIWICLGKAGVKRFSLSGSALTETASFRLAGLSSDALCGWEPSLKERDSYCANGLAVDDRYVYVAHGGAGLIVLDKKDLSFVTRTRNVGKASANYVSLNEDGYIYVAYGLAKVHVYAWKNR